MKEEYKPCPFCGSTNIAKVLLPGFMWIVGCNDCGCRTSEHIRSSEAVRSWNTRPDPEDEVRSVAEIINEMAEQGSMPTLCENTPF